LLIAARSAAPYLLVEILLPGGTLIALALWLLSPAGKAQRSQALLWMRRITGWIPSLSR
jgi:hypothetical protein